MKRICAIFCLDEDTSHRIQGYRDALAAVFGLPKSAIYPHITIAHFIEIDPDEIISYSKAFVTNVKCFSVQLDAIGVFSGSCVASMINPTGEITNLYHEYHNAYDALCDKWTKKENNLWQPHSTIYVGAETRLEEMKDYLEGVFIPFEGRAVRFELSQINDNGFEIIYSQELLLSTNN